jgi:hypothetical protein
MAPAPQGFFFIRDSTSPSIAANWSCALAADWDKALARRSHRANHLISACRNLILCKIGDLLCQLADFIAQTGEIDGGNRIDTPTYRILCISKGRPCPKADRALPAASS